MKTIRSLSDWVFFTAEIKNYAWQTLREFGLTPNDVEVKTQIAKFRGLEADTHLDFVTGRDDDDRERAAFATIVLCDEINDVIGRFETGPAQHAAALAGLAWRLHMVTTGLYRGDVHPAFLSVFQSERGKKGAQRRWANSKEFSEIIENLATKIDMLGDPEEPLELWPQLYSALDNHGLGPTESDDAITFDGGSIRYDAFRKRIHRLRDRAQKKRTGT